MKSAKRIKNGICGGKLKTALVYNKVNLGKHELSQRFEMVYTPKKASWLNMAEIELSALSKQCLDRRIAQRRILTKEVLEWSAKRNRLQTRITWQFTKSKAREKLGRLYNIIHN